MDTLYEHCYYLIKETKKPKYLDFYELEEKDFEYPMVVSYLEQTVRYNDKWYFITTKNIHYRTIEERDKAPKVYIKELYKKERGLRWNILNLEVGRENLIMK